MLVTYISVVYSKLAHVVEIWGIQVVQYLRLWFFCVFGFDGQTVYWICVVEELPVQAVEGNEAFEEMVTGLEVAVNDNPVAIDRV